MSIRSRDSRIVGTWNLTSILSNNKTKVQNGISTNNEPIDVIVTFPENVDSISAFKIKRTVVVNDIKDSVYKEVLVINEDGTYSDTIKCGKLNQKAAIKYTTRVVSNNWYWLDAKKNKEGIMLIGYGTFSVDRLAWKEIVFTSKEETQKTTGSNTVTYSVSKELKFGRN